MIVSSGSGYNDGWRLAVYDWKTRQPTLDIGQAKGSFSVRANDALSAGFWNHLAATWDGAQVRLYINGMLSAVKPYEGTMVNPKASLKIGFSGYGVGSLKMAVDELVVLNHALSSEEIAGLALVDAPLPEGLKTLVRNLQEASVDEKSVAEFRTAQQALSAFPACPTVWKQWSDLMAARRLAGTSDAASLATFEALFDNADLPAHLRGQVVESLVQASRRGVELPSRILSKLPEFMELDADEQRLFALSLASAYVREKDADAATGVFAQLLTFSEAMPLDTAEVRQRYARMLQQAGRFDAARKQYAAILSDTRLPLHVRGIAALATAQTWRQDKNSRKPLTRFAPQPT